VLTESGGRGRKGEQTSQLGDPVSWTLPNRPRDFAGRGDLRQQQMARHHWPPSRALVPSDVVVVVSPVVATRGLAALLDAAESHATPREE